MRTDVMWAGYLRAWSQEDFSQVLRAHVSDWLQCKGEGTVWFTPPNLVPTWMKDEVDELLLQPLSSWQQGTVFDA
jgi:hypothetical protein